MTRGKFKRRKRKVKQEFKDFATTKQGGAGEAIALQYFARRGYVAYPVGTDGPHPVDFVLYNPDTRGFIAVEVKTYPRLFSSEETGIDANDYKSYCEIQREGGIRVYLLFVDAFEGISYGAFLNDLRAGARLEKGKVYFPLGLFKGLYRLTSDDLSTLGDLPHPARYRFLRRYFEG